MRIAYRLSALAVLCLAFASAFAQSSIKVTTFPSLSVADGKSTVTITAEVRDSNGKAVRDGTNVLFETSDLGCSFREQSSSTISGIARGVLVAGTIKGIATITVTAPGGDCSPTTIHYEFVANRSELSSAREYIEIVAPGYMQYTADTKIIGAAGPNGGVFLRYKDLTLTADDIQYEIPTYEVKARKATLTIGKFTKKFDELFFRLNFKTGFGTTTYLAKRSDSVVTQGVGIAFVNTGADGKVVIPPDEDRYGLVQVSRSGVSQAQSGNAEGLFRFEDLSRSPSTISAKKAIVFPKRKIQFQRAEIYIAGARVLKIPLYEYNLANTTPLVTEQMLGVVDSQIQLNYPYILSMRPGETSLFRFRTGDEYGRGDTTDHGAFLSYELNWDKGDDMQGGLMFSGIGRNDWEVGVNQYMRFDDRSSASLQVLSPTGQSYFGTGTVSRQYDGFSVSLNGDATRTIEGIQYTSTDYAAVIQRDPMKVGMLPVRVTMELTATAASNQLLDESQSGAGARIRAQTLPLPIDPNTNLTSSFTTSYLRGVNELNGPQFLGTTSLSHRFNSAMSAVFTYNFTRDGFNQYVMGEHQVSLQGFYNRGNVNFSVLGDKALDIERATVFGDLSYRVSKLWRLTSSYTYDTYLNTTFLDYTFGFGYKLGWREVGLIWSEQTKRIGFQLLGTTVY